MSAALYRNAVEERWDVLVVTLSMGKTTVVDNNEAMKTILRAYRFRANKYVSAKTGERFYAETGSGGTKQALHRIIMSIDTDLVGLYVRHRDGNSLNNCRANLELCTPNNIMLIARRLRHTVPGVFRRNGGWMATKNVSGGKREYKMFSFAYNEPGRAYDLAVQWVTGLD